MIECGRENWELNKGSERVHRDLVKVYKSKWVVRE